MTYQHQILPENPRLEVRVALEAYGYFEVRYRCVDERFAHRDDWRVIEHCSAGETADVILAIYDGFQDDLVAQQLF